MVVVPRWRKNEDCALVLQLSEDEGFFIAIFLYASVLLRSEGDAMNNDGDDDNNLEEDT